MNLNEKKEAKDLFVSNYNKYHSKFKSSNHEANQINSETNRQTLVPSTLNTNKKKERSLSMMERFFEGAKSKSSKSSKTDYQNYFDELNVRFSRDYDVLGFWKENEIKFPILAKMAKDFLSIQPTNVSSERCFSQTGLVVTNLRNQLHPETVRQIMCLKSWTS